MAPTGAEVWRDYVTDGIPASGDNDPKKSEIRSWATWVESIITAFTSNGGLLFTLRSSLESSLNFPASTMAWVIGDPAPGNNGVYQKLGASGIGSWARRADLPYSFIVASDTGAGTPDAIQATSSLPVSSSALVVLNVFEANVGSPVTVSFNGGSALTIKTNSGSNIAPGGIVAGMLLLGYVSGSDFRLVSDQVSSAILAQAEDFAERAEAAAAAAESAIGRLEYSVTAFGAVGDDATNNDTTLNSAIAFAKAIGADLYWPEGTYLTTATIIDLHSVRHRGPGAIKRGTDVFYVDPKPGQSNRIYVATAGSADNDGITASQPFGNLAAAFACLKSKGVVLEGTWRVMLAAGTYTGAANWLNNLEGVGSRSYIIFQGPDIGGHPNVPTAILDGPGDSSALYAMQFSRCTVMFQDIKFQNFPTGATGLSLIRYVRSYCINVHTFNCGNGISSTSLSALSLEGGIFDGNNLPAAIGIFSAFASVHTVGSDTPPTIKNCRRGFYAAEGATGVVVANYEDNVIGAEAQSFARVNGAGSSFKRSTQTAVKVYNGAVFIDASNTVNFHTGTADANIMNLWRYSGGNDARHALDAVDPRNEVNRVVSITNTGSTSETLAFTYILDGDRIPQTAGSQVVGREIEIEVHGEVVGTVGSKAVIIRLGTSDTGTAGLQVGGASLNSAKVGKFMLKCNITIGSPTVVVGFTRMKANTGEEVIVSHEPAINLADGLDRWIKISTSLGDGADTVSIRTVRIQIA